MRDPNSNPDLAPRRAARRVPTVAPYRIVNRRGAVEAAAGGAVRRHATWLELFFDLVFVLAITELAGLLHSDPTLVGVKHFALLFVPVWWAWMGYSYYADQFDSDDVPDSAGFRITMLLAMLLTVVLAVTVHDALAGGSAAFAGAYVALRLLLVALYFHAGRQVPEARDLCARFAVGFAAGAGLWLGSLLVPEPWRYVVWALALVVEIATPAVAYLTTPVVPAQRSHMPERFGLFTILVLGEAVIVVGGGIAASTAWAWRPTLVATLGFVVAACLWWLYFDRTDEEAISRAVASGARDALARSFVYGYSHLFIYGGITAVSVGIELAVEALGEHELAAGARLALCGGLATVVLAFSANQWASANPPPNRVHAARLVAVGAIAAVGLVGAELSPAPLVVLVAAALVALTAFEVTGAWAPAIAPEPEGAPAA